MSSFKIIPRSEHSISRKDISNHALKVLYQLRQHDFEAYLVGGGVRDLLLKLHPKDFDVVTNARPEQIRKIFSRSFIIGRRFKLVHVYFGQEYIEVATFRGPHNEADQKKVGRFGQSSNIITNDNIYGNMHDDAWRRDFTINALYYDINGFGIVDYVGGMADIAARRIVVIGNPKIRYLEDPVRMLRALRFVAKLDFVLEDSAEQAIYTCRDELDHISPNRLFDEYCKLFLTGHAVKSFVQLQKYDLFKKLFPDTKPNSLIDEALKNTDLRYTRGLSLMPGFLAAVFLWEELHKKLSGVTDYDNISRCTYNLMRLQSRVLSIPKKVQAQIESIYLLQWRFLKYKRYSKRGLDNLRANFMFRAGVEFLRIRHQSGEPGLEAMVKFWNQFMPDESQHAE